MANIIVFDDDKDILRIIKHSLEKLGHAVACYEKVTNFDMIKLIQYQLILLDIMMPDIDGFEFCKNIRDKVDCPIIFITSKSSDQDLLKGFAKGADDYIKKPFSIIELRARVEAHLRRENRISKNGFTIGNISFYMESKEVFIREMLINLTKSQYEICEFLALNRGHTFSKSQIYNRIFGFDKDTYENVIVEHIKNIRNKFNQYEETPIVTVWGIGYKWVE